MLYHFPVAILLRHTTYAYKVCARHFHRRSGSHEKTNRTRRFITMFKSPSHWTIPWDRWMHFTLQKPIYFRSIIISPSHLRLGLLSGSSYWRFSTKALTTFSSGSPWVDHPNTFISGKKNANYEATLYSVFFGILLFPSVSPNQSSFFWCIKQRSPLEDHRRFGGTSRHHL
jgi:hypothetical protein